MRWSGPIPATRASRRAGECVAAEPAAPGGRRRNLPLADASVAAVVAVDTLEHIPKAERPAVIAEMLRVTAPGGRVVLMGPTGPEAAAGDAYLLERHRERGTQNGPVVWLSEHLEHGLPTVEELVGLLAQGRTMRIAAKGVFNLRMWRVMHRAALADYPQPRGAHLVHHLAWAPFGAVGPPPAPRAVLPLAGRGGARLSRAWRRSASTRSSSPTAPATSCGSACAPSCPRPRPASSCGSASSTTARRTAARTWSRASSRSSGSIRHPVNLGFGIANDRLAATSTATHLLLLNPDTRVEGRLVGPLLAALEADPAIAVAAPRLVFPDGEVQASSERFPTLAFELARELRGRGCRRCCVRSSTSTASSPSTGAPSSCGPAPRTTPTSPGPTCWLLRRSDAEATGLFDPRFPVYDEDLDLCSRLRAAGRRVVYVPDAEVVHLGGSSSTSERKRELMRAGRARWYRRHRGPAAALTYRGIVAGVGAAKALTARVRGA